MRRLAIGTFTLLLALSAHAREIRDPFIESFAAKAMIQCPGAVFHIEPVEDKGPVGFNSYRVTQSSTDDRCSQTTFMLISQTSNQILMGAVYVIAEDSRSIQERIQDFANRAMRKKTTVMFEPTPLPDGVRAVQISFDTPYGKLPTRAFLDASQTFLIAGRALDRTVDPRKQILAAVKPETGAKRGAAKGVIDIVEVSDFQCPTCQRAHMMMEPFFKKYGSKISYTRVDLPFFEHHDWTLKASLAARALQKVAPQQYWAYVDFIFSNQDNLTAKNIDEQIKNFMADHDVDMKKIQPFCDSMDEKKKLVDQVARIYDADINATPTLLVNGQRIYFASDSKYFWEYVGSLLGVTVTPPVAPKPPAKPASK